MQIRIDWPYLFLSITLIAFCTSVSAEDVPIKISKETTYITKPLRKDGTVDYFTTLREQHKKGVTPENNAAVLLWQVFNPNEVDSKIASRFFKELEMPIPSKENYLSISPYSVSEGEDEKELARHEQLCDFAISNPWKSKDFPELASWVKLREKQIKIIEEATKRPKFYYPIIRYS